MKNFLEKFRTEVIIIAAIVLVGGLVTVFLAGQLAGVPDEEAIPRGYATKCYMEPGGNKWTCASGGEIEIQSGATLDVQSGATFSVGAVQTIGDGSAAAPGLAFTSDTDSGVYRIGANNVGFAAGGAAAFDYDGSTLDVDNLTVSDSDSAVTIADNAIVDGAADAIQFTVQGYTTQTNLLLVAETSAGTDKFTIDNSGNIVGAGTASIAAGTSSAPGYWFAGDSNSGLYSIGADNIGLTLGGSKIWDYGVSSTSMVGQLQAPNGTAAAPAYGFTSDTNTGIYRSSSDYIGFAAGGTSVAYIGASIKFTNTVNTSAINANGNLYNSGGSLTIGDAAMVDGAADAIQLTVQGYTTQTAGLFVAETSAGTDKFTIDNSGNIVAAGTSDLQGTVTVGGGYGGSGSRLDDAGAAWFDSNVKIDGTLAVTSTSDLRGNVSDSGGVFTIADNTMVDGAADAIQLTVQGYTTQTSGLFVAETSAGTDKFTIDNSGNIVAAGTSDLQGTVTVGGGYGGSGSRFDDAGAAWFDSNVIVDGAVSITGTLTTNGAVVHSCAAYALTGDQNLTPAEGCYAVSTAVTLTLQTSGVAAGTIVILTETGANNLIISDTNARTSTGSAITLGQYDVIAFIFTGSEWYELYFLANS